MNSTQEIPNKAEPVSISLKVNLTPEEEELNKKRAELSQSEADLCDRELELETLRAQLLSFERDTIGSGWC